MREVGLALESESEGSVDVPAAKDDLPRALVPKDHALVDPNAVLVGRNAVMVDQNAIELDRNAIVVEPSAVLVDRSAVMVEPGAVLVDRNAIMVDPSAVSVDPSAVLVEPNAIMVGPARVLSCLGAGKRLEEGVLAANDGLERALLPTMGALAAGLGPLGLLLWYLPAAVAAFDRLEKDEKLVDEVLAMSPEALAADLGAARVAKAHAEADAVQKRFLALAAALPVPDHRAATSADAGRADPAPSPPDAAKAPDRPRPRPAPTTPRRTTRAPEPQRSTSTQLAPGHGPAATVALCRARARGGSRMNEVARIALCLAACLGAAACSSKSSGGGGGTVSGLTCSNGSSVLTTSYSSACISCAEGSCNSELSGYSSACAAVISCDCNCAGSPACISACGDNITDSDPCGMAQTSTVNCVETNCSAQCAGNDADGG